MNPAPKTQNVYKANNYNNQLMEPVFFVGRGEAQLPPVDIRVKMLLYKLSIHLVAKAGGALCQEVLLDLEPGDQVQGGGQEGGEQEEKQGENKGLI